ncbi:MAG TPA: ABC transporter permease [Gemmatimonadaceae bacterium]|jgi:predicted permease
MASSDSAKWHRYLRFWRANVGADVDDELTFHIDARMQELRERGLSADAARAEAVREFGDVEDMRNTLRTMDERHAATARRVHFADDLLRDTRVALRGLRRSPGLVAVVTLTFALGIGITSAIYGVVDSLIFRPLPGRNTSSLVVLGRTDRAIPLPHDLNYPDFEFYRADTTTFSALVAYTSRIAELATDHGADRIFIDEGTSNYFSVLGLDAMLGRTFAPGDDEGVLAHPSIVLTYDAWATRFGSDSSIVGRVIRINDHPMTVIGVMPPQFHGVRPIVDIDGVAPFRQIWPVDEKMFEDRGVLAAVSVFGRLRRGVSLERARTTVATGARQLARAYPTTDGDANTIVAPEQRARPNIGVSSVTAAIAMVFMVLVLLVLLVACANVASILLARVVVRGRELAIRAAIGASQWRLVRQIMVECALLAICGGIAATGVAYVAIHKVESIHLATDLPLRWGIEFDGRVVFFTMAATLFAAIVAGIAPATAARRRNLGELLKSSVGNSATRGHQRLRSALVVAQVAVSVVVLVAAGLFTRSSLNALRMDVGFRRDSLLLLTTTLRPQSYDSTRGQLLYRELRRRVAEVQGVRDVGLAAYLPFGFGRDNLTIYPIATSVPVPPGGFSYFTNVVDGDYFAAMGIPLREGRLFTERDDEHAPNVAVINESLAKALWPGQPAVGKQFHVGSDTGRIVQVVGVVRGMQDLFPGESPKPYIFRPLGQSYHSEMTLIVHTARKPVALAPQIRVAMTAVDRGLPVYDVRTMDEHLFNGQALIFTRLGSAFSSVFGILALILAVVGVYGVVSYSVAQRTREIGVRMALGARLSGILRLVVGQGVKLVWIGLGVGLVLSLATSGVLSSILYGVGPKDPLVIGAVIIILTFGAAVASLVPAHRATRIDPIRAIREE